MTEEATPAVDEVPSDKDRNFEALRLKSEAQEQELAELRPLKHESIVRNAGFNPDSGEGKSLMRDLASGLVKAEDGKEISELLAAYADAEYGWKPPPQLTPTEQPHVDAAARQAARDAIATPVTPTDVGQQIAAAQASGDTKEVIRLATQEAMRRPAD